jgi:prevent-host-death family protein
MQIINVHEAKTHLSRILDEVAAGEEIILAKAGKPLARLSPFVPEKSKIKFGLAKGKAWIADDFDAPLPDELQALFDA